MSSSDKVRNALCCTDFMFEIAAAAGLAIQSRTVASQPVLPAAAENILSDVATTCWPTGRRSAS